MDNARGFLLTQFLENQPRKWSSWMLEYPGMPCTSGTRPRVSRDAPGCNLVRPGYTRVYRAPGHLSTRSAGHPPREHGHKGEAVGISPSKKTKCFFIVYALPTLCVGFVGAVAPNPGVLWGGSPQNKAGALGGGRPPPKGTRRTNYFLRILARPIWD